MRYNKNDIVRLEITDIQAEGMGVGKVDGYALFVKDTVVGDVIDARIVKVKKSYGYGRVERIISPSPKRVEPRCPIARACGGCQLQAMSYDAQLEFKENKVRNVLVRIGGFEAEFIDSIMEPIIGMDDPWRYRNKAQYPIGTDKDGNPVAGFYAGRTHDIIPCTDCLLGVPENKEILEAVLSYMKEHDIPAYDEKTGEGVVRHVLIRKGFNTGEIMVCIVVKRGDGSSVHFSFNKFANIVTLEMNRGTVPPFHSLSVSINNKKTNVIMGNEIHTIWGKDKISDILLGKKFEISPLSFYQVNPIQVEKLYGTAIEYAGLTGSEEVWDICCGIGTISLCMTDKAKVVHGLEIVPEAIEDAKRNAKLNNVDNAEFICAAAEEFLPVHKDEIKADVVVMDPPRKGMDEAALAAVIDIAPARIVYVSCDPATLARDLKYLTGHGYELKRLRCTDMFCQTVHVETVCLLSKLSSAKHHIEINVDMDELDLTSAEAKATYEEIRNWVQEKYGLHVEE
ncbi:MAG: 23S rRNA (uracil(1939)-C(5))-methyltransferase RlmD [Lachnospiraceae bacterium]|nr:23S rRNA (uracil(1939)-C(5))-methyltransferase RlmD [Lachnospiraceae bacterium]